MSKGLPSPLLPYLKALGENGALAIGALAGAFGGIYEAAIGALLGFMIDRVRAAISAASVGPADAAERDDPGETGEPEAAAEEKNPRDPRAVLGLGADAGPEEIRRAFRRISKESHPDAGAPSEEGARRFREAREAYEALVGNGGISRLRRE